MHLPPMESRKPGRGCWDKLTSHWHRVGSSRRSVSGNSWLSHGKGLHKCRLHRGRHDHGCDQRDHRLGRRQRWLWRGRFLGFDWLHRPFSTDLRLGLVHAHEPHSCQSQNCATQRNQSTPWPPETPRRFCGQRCCVHVRFSGCYDRRRRGRNLPGECWLVAVVSDVLATDCYVGFAKGPITSIGVRPPARH